MLVSIRPPEYFPRPAFFALMDRAERFVVADTVQYSRQSYQNRARLRTPQGWQWISVPLKGGQHGRPIGEVRIENREPWPRKHWRSLEYNYRSSPYFEHYEPELRPLFEARWDRLGALTVECARLLRGLFGVETPLVVASELSGENETLGDLFESRDGERLLSPAESAAHDAAVAGVGAVLTCEPGPYRQTFEGFEAGMSVLDLLFNHGPEALRLVREATVVRPFVGGGAADPTRF